MEPAPGAKPPIGSNGRAPAGEGAPRKQEPPRLGSGPAGNRQPPSLGSGAGVLGTIPGLIAPSRPISHSPPITDSDTTYWPSGSISTSSANASGSPLKSVVRVTAAWNPCQSVR